MSSWKQQALIKAPVREVWELLVDPSRAPEWSSDTLDITGAPAKIEVGSTFDVTSRGPLRMKATTTFAVDALEDLREIRMQCQKSGFYTHWLLTEAQGGTFTELELGVEPKPGLEARAVGALHTKRYLRRVCDLTLDELQRAVARFRAAART
jgi:uncharacterized protein YndB with AHSA1/START domain